MKSTRSLEELKDLFLSNVSHEFRSPLASLMGYMDLMIRTSDTLTPKHRDYLKTMRESAGRLNNFVDTLLDLTRLEAGRMECSPEPVDIRSIFDDILQNHRREIEAEHLTVSVECVPHLCAVADLEMLRKAVSHLLSNAIHFTPQGGQITLWAKDSGHKSVLLGISDSGVGIPREMFERVFEKFEQVSETKNVPRKNYGTGLGLTLVRGLLERQGGKVWVQQSSRKGTTLAWVLPKPARTRGRLSAFSPRIGRAA